MSSKQMKDRMNEQRTTNEKKDWTKKSKQVEDRINKQKDKQKKQEQKYKWTKMKILSKQN